LQDFLYFQSTHSSAMLPGRVNRRAQNACAPPSTAIQQNMYLKIIHFTLANKANPYIRQTSILDLHAVPWKTWYIK